MALGQPPDSLSRHAVPDGKQDGRRGVPLSTRHNDAPSPRHSSAQKVFYALIKCGESRTLFQNYVNALKNIDIFPGTVSADFCFRSICVLSVEEVAETSTSVQQPVCCRSATRHKNWSHHENGIGSNQAL